MDTLLGRAKSHSLAAGMVVAVILVSSLTTMRTVAQSYPTSIGTTTAATSTDMTIVGSNTVSAGSFNGTLLQCPSGTVPVGGGLDPENVLTMQLTSSSPLFGQAPPGNYLFSQPDGINPAPTGWVGFVRNNSAGTAGSKVGVVCRYMAGVQTIVDSASVAPGSFNGVRVTCPDGTAAINGGVDPENVFSMQVTSSAPTFVANGNRLLFQPDGPNPAPNGWQATVRNGAATVQSFKVGVLCASEPGISTVVGSQTVNTGTFGGVLLQCPANTIALSGGIDPNNVLTMTVTSSSPLFGTTPPANYLFSQPDGTNPPPSGWTGFIRNDSASAQLIKVAAICAPLKYVTFIPLAEK